MHAIIEGKLKVLLSAEIDIMLFYIPIRSNISSTSLEIRFHSANISKVQEDMIL